ncbi:DUF2971 domain-containing protein [Thalassomonas haliotis]|uniref:DUF2971 domain-containing protein n=1 Tax=Thalassomonas haliotis TaxID=485448 RepID=A0ABY7VEF6_9GAMM|nr:DUF2971 domain-containing protein [Thalassomonas haliotis]WDE11752.1 DUF2971 domain-containing protein [Thalassomonas haliotis]
MVKPLTDKEVNKLILTAVNKSRFEQCDESIILFLLTSGLKISDLFELKISDVMYENGEWRDIVFLSRFGGRKHIEGILYLTNLKLKLALDNYVDFRISQRHLCTFNWKCFRGLQACSPLLLNRYGEPFSTVLSKTNHKKRTAQQNKVKRIFSGASLSDNEAQYTQRCYATFEDRLKNAGFLEEESEVIRKGSKKALESAFSDRDSIKIKKIIKGLYKNIKSGSNKKDDDIVYHYCSASSFIEIINGGAIWFSDLFKMNDPDELSRNLAICRVIANEIVSNKENFEEILNITEVGEMRVFSCSFSKKGDDLDQWRSYADDGEGFCIGFERRSLQKVLASLFQNQKIHTQNSMEYFNIEDVSYDGDISKNTVEDKFKLLWRDYNREFESQSVPNDLTEQIKSYIWKTSAIHKNSFYQYEDEVRAFVRGNLTNLSEPRILNINYRSGAYGITPYIKVPILNSICQVILGPKSRSSIEDVSYFLKSKQISPLISPSKGKYR